MHPTQKLQNASATHFCIEVHFLNHHITTLQIMFGILLLLILFVTFLCQISFLCIEYPNLGSSQHSRHNSSAINCDWVYSEWAPNWLNFPMQFSKTGPVGALKCIGATICIVSPQTGERKVHFPISAFSPCGYFAVIMHL